MPRRSIQQTLPFAARALRPAEGRAEPPVWVCRFALWQDVARKPIRDFELHRGLNIVWSPVTDQDEELASGHAAGKTLFCRLLRYCLGEDAFADPEDVQAIRTHFQNGAAGVVLRIGGQTWTVRRPFRPALEDRAAPVASFRELESAEEVQFEEYLEALRAVAFDGTQRRLVRGVVHDGDPWLLLLAWMTRDQECRLDGLTHWRHPETSSQSPVRSLSHESRLLLLRSFTGLYTERSAGLRRRVNAASEELRKATDARAGLAGLFRNLRGEIARALSLDEAAAWPDAEPDTDVSASRAVHRAWLDGLVTQRIKNFTKVAGDPEHAKLAQRLADDEGELERLKADLEQLEGERKNANERADLSARDAGDAGRRLRFARNPECPYDGARLDVAKAAFVCPLPRFDDEREADASYQAETAARDDARRDRDRVSALYANARAARATQARVVKSLQSRVTRNEEEVAKAKSESDPAWAARAQIPRLFEVRAELDAAMAAEQAARTADKARRDAQVSGLREDSTTHVGQWFEALVRGVVAGVAEGRVVLDGTGLHPTILWRGRRRSVALNSLQIVLFDLAAVFASVEGHGCVPGFLVHDSPREGDLDAATYGRLFRTVEKLAADAATASFQYIITTTTDPPEELRRERVCLDLGAGVEERRLFMVDF